MTPSTCKRFLLVTALALSATACTHADHLAGGGLGVERVMRPTEDVAALDADLSLFDPARSGGKAWYHAHISHDDPCRRPFLVVEDPDGNAADIFFDTRCR